MVWKALEALGMLSEALGSFDVNTVCPLPGSWINHVVRLWELLVLEGFGKFWEALEGSAGFAKFCKALGGFVGRS